MKQHDVPKQCAHGLCGSKELHLFFKINRLQCSETLSGFFVNSLVAWGEFLDRNRPLDIRRLCIRGESPTGDAVADIRIELREVPRKLAKRAATRVRTEVILAGRQHLQEINGFLCFTIPDCEKRFNSVHKSSFL